MAAGRESSKSPRSRFGRTPDRRVILTERDRDIACEVLAGRLLSRDHLIGLGFFGFVLFGLLVLFLGDGLGRHGFGNARAALLVKRLRLEGEFALRALDGPLVQVVEAHCAIGAHTLGSQIRLDQSHSSRMKSVS